MATVKLGSEFRNKTPNKSEDTDEIVLENEQDEIIDVVIGELEDDDAEETETSEGSEEGSQDSEENSEDDPEKGKPRRRSRAEHRITQLTSSNRELEQRAAEAEKRLQEAEARQKEMEERLASTATSTRDTDKARLEALKKALLNEYKQATINDDVDRLAEITDQLTEINIDLRQLESAPTPPPKKEPEAPAPRQPVSTSLSIPQKAEEWSESNPWFTSPENRAEKALRLQAATIINELKQLGYSPEEDEFYKELDGDLKAYAEEKKLEVEGIWKKPKTSKQKSSPTMGGKPNVGSGKKTVRLTQEEVEFCKRIGLSTQAFAKQKLAREENPEMGNRRRLRG